MDYNIDYCASLLKEKETLEIENSAENLKKLNASNLAINLNKAVNQYKQLKRIVLGQQTKLLLCENLEDPNLLDKETINKEFDVSQAECKEAKNTIEDCKCEIEELADQLDSMLQTYREKYNELKEVYEEVLKKKQHLDSKTTEKCDKKDEDITMAKHHATILERVSHELVHMEKLQADWHHELKILKTEGQQLVETVNTMQGENKQLQKRLISYNLNNDTWMDDLEKLTLLSGVRVQSFTGTKLILQLSDQEPVIENTMMLTVDFEVDENKEYVIQNAQVNLASLDISDIVKEAITYNELNMLVVKVRDRWMMTKRLMDEIEGLRDKYALDWRCNEGVVQVLYGDVICNLTVDSTYPQPGSITLASVTGLQENITPKPPPELTSLTDWLQYLQNMISTTS